MRCSRVSTTSPTCSFLTRSSLVFLQLPRFTKDVEDCETLFDKLIYVLKNMEVLNRMPWLAQEEENDLNIKDYISCYT